jgi:hypothetical protein
MSPLRTLAVWATFAIVHAILILENLFAPNQPLGDVENTYPTWWSMALEGFGFPGLSADGVYPYLALGPIAVAAGGVGAWFALIVALDAIAVAVLARRSELATYVWLGFQLALGPIALGRIDSVTVALAIIVVAIIDRAPRTAGTLIAVATWVKVWPIALGIAALRSPRFGSLARSSFTVAIGLALLGILIGDRLSVFSFFGEQQGRGIQVEAVAATPWLWDAWAGGASVISFSPDIYTFEIDGRGTELVAELLTTVQVCMLLGIVLLLLSHRRTVGTVSGASFGYALLALVALLVSVNKVGSPQFVSWFAVPLVAIVLVNGQRSTTVLVALIGSIATLTHVIYPYAYFAFLELRTIPLVLITIRNLVEVALLVTALVVLVMQLRVEKLAYQFANLGIGDKEGIVPVR